MNNDQIKKFSGGAPYPIQTPMDAYDQLEDVVTFGLDDIAPRIIKHIEDAMELILAGDLQSAQMLLITAVDSSGDMTRQSGYFEYIENVLGWLDEQEIGDD